MLKVEEVAEIQRTHSRASENKAMDSLLQPLEGTWCPQHNDFGPVNLISDL